MSTYPILLAVDSTLLREGDVGHLHPQFFETSQTLDQQSLDVTIGHDVWIGAHATILAGVTIGTGAVIGTRALVTSDVPPYAVVGGVPAKVLRYRHPPTIVEALLQSAWWLLEPDEIWRRCGSLIESRRVADVLAMLCPYAAPAHSIPVLVTSEASLPARSTQAHLALAPDLDNCAHVLAPLGLADLHRLLTDPAFADGKLPRWPDADTQRQFTAGDGVELMRRTLDFVKALDRDGAFANSEWQGLDFGCGWGRIASVLLTRGRPDQLELCDAWQSSLDLLNGLGFRNRQFLVPERLEVGSLPSRRYDFAFAFSVLTHLGQTAFEAAVSGLARAVKPGGKLYFTVRHQDFLVMLKRKTVPGLRRHGFWHEAYRNLDYYGETITTQRFLANLCGASGRLRRLGVVDYYQHLYALDVD